MSIRKDVWVRCDNCGEGGFASHTSKQARMEANKYGWVFRNGKDYCPNCKDHVPKNPVCTCGLKRDPVGWNRHKKECQAYKPHRKKERKGGGVVTQDEEPKL